VFRTGFFCLLLASLSVQVGADEGAEDRLRDPTRPLDYRPGERSVDLQLNSILVGGDRRLAVINGQQLRENQVIANSGGVRIRRIESRRVVLEQDGNTWNLSLAGEPVRRSRSTDN